MTWLSCPPAKVDDRRDRVRSADPRRPRGVPFRLDAGGTLAGLPALAHGLAEDRPVDRPEQVMAAGEVLGSQGRTNSSNVTAEDTGLPGSPNSRNGRSPTRPIC